MDRLHCGNGQDASGRQVGEADGAGDARQAGHGFQAAAGDPAHLLRRRSRAEIGGRRPGPRTRRVRSPLRSAVRSPIPGGAAVAWRAGVGQRPLPNHHPPRRRTPPTDARPNTTRAARISDQPSRQHGPASPGRRRPGRCAGPAKVQRSRRRGARSTALRRPASPRRVGRGGRSRGRRRSREGRVGAKPRSEEGGARRHRPAAPIIRCPGSR